MVLTPWGTSESLRERKMRPGPGSHTIEVERKQRERVFGAMVAAVSERGYTATKVSDLVELSGVSSRTFYDLFGDKQTCFLETVEALLALAGEAALAGDVGGSPAGERPDWEQGARGALAASAAMIAGQPAAARVVLIEAPAASPAAMAALDAAIASLESRAAKVLAASPERAGMPAEMVSAQIGALREITRNRLHRGAAVELQELVDEVAELLLSYRPPPEPLRLAKRLPATRPEDLDAHNPAERVQRALAVVVTEKGYTQTTIDEVIARASMSASTFYANFSGKEDALMSAIDSAGAQMVAAAMPAFERRSSWSGGVRAAYDGLFSFLASRPALAHLMAVGVYGAGPAATRRRARALAPLAPLLEERGSEQRLQPPPIAAEAIAGAVYGLAYRHVRSAGAQSLPTLAPICTYLTLAPFIGAEGACAAANGDGGGPAGKQAGGAAAGTLTGAGEREEPADVASARLIDEDEWAQMSPDERVHAAARVADLIGADVGEALAPGSPGAEIERHLSRASLRVDRRGWRELLAIGEQAQRRSVEVQQQSAERLRQSGEPPIDARAVQMLFASAPSPGERERLLAAAKAVFAKRGFQASTPSHIAAAAKVDVEAFSAHFKDTDECLIEVYEAIVADARAAIAVELSAQGSWGERLCAGLHALLRLIAAEPLAARIALIEVQSGGRGAVRRYGATLDELVAFLAEGRTAEPERPELPPHFEAATASGVVWLLQGHLDRGEAADVESLFSEIAKVALEPYLGEEEAHRQIKRFLAKAAEPVRSGSRS
jgi:AcrR family transcriptional regulator